MSKLAGSVLARFPKRRPELPAAYQMIYAQHYRDNRDGATPATSVSSRLERWLHRQVAEDVQDTNHLKSTLEIGAGTLNQLAYEPGAAPYDIVEPFTALYEGSPILTRVRNRYNSIKDVPAGAKYDRVTAVATFEHICELPDVVARSGLLLGDGGTLRVAIPAEGTLLWTMGWRFTTGVEFRRRHGLDYATLMRHEHVNTAAEIETVLGHFYAEVKCRVFGISRGLSLYQAFVCRRPILDRCRAGDANVIRLPSE